MNLNLFKWSVKTLLLVSCFSLVLLGQVCLCQNDQDAEGEFIGRAIKRQVMSASSARGRQVAAKQEASMSGSAMATSSVSEPANQNSNSNFDKNDTPTGQPMNPPKRPAQAAKPEYDDESDQQNRPPKSKKQPAKRPPVDRYEQPSEEGGEEEDCYEDDYDDFRHLVHEPMRHIARMMNNVFGQMSSGAMMDPGNSRGNFASSSAVSSGDGYSRMTSSVSNNGRTRGISSETRNGRTQTRRFGMRDDEEESDVNSNSDRYNEEDE